MTPHTLDTNSIIYYINDDTAASPVVREILRANGAVYVSAITEIELLAFPQLTDAETEEIRRILQLVSIIPVDSAIAQSAGALRRTCRLSVPDSAIAATALFTGSTLLTRNVRDFRKIPQLKIMKI